MFKITKETESTTRVQVNVYGRFTGEYVPELEKILIENGSEQKRLTLDLLNVTFVDREAMKFLSRAKSKTATLVNTPSYVKRWIEQEAHDGCL